VHRRLFNAGKKRFKDPEKSLKPLRTGRRTPISMSTAPHSSRTRFYIFTPVRNVRTAFVPRSPK
jgi:hypothetical protein